MRKDNQRQLIRATILAKKGCRILAQVSYQDLPPRVVDNKFNIINNFKYCLYDGDVVSGCLINMLPHSRKRRHNYHFYIKENIDRRVQFDAYVPVINEMVVEKINNMSDLYGRPKEIIAVDDMTMPIRKPVFVLARNLGMYLQHKFFRSQMSEGQIVNTYGMTRHSLYYGLKRLSDETDPDVNKVKNELEDELNKIINNIS